VVRVACKTRWTGVATVDDALKALAQRSELSDVLARIPVRMAVNREYAEPASELHCGTSWL